jgi:hypothetical protein
MFNVKQETPGPGNYRIPSDFGYYKFDKGKNKKYSSVTARVSPKNKKEEEEVIEL